MINESLWYMKEHAPQAELSAFGRRQSWNGFYYYSMFYATRAFHFRGGRDWLRWYQYVKRMLLTEQIEDKDANNTHWGKGFGYEEAGGNSYYATAMALLILQTPNKYLPISQK